jgi:hypothetical protein
MSGISDQRSGRLRRLGNPSGVAGKRAKIACTGGQFFLGTGCEILGKVSTGKYV